MSNSWVLILFNLLFTSVPPIIYGVLDRDIPADTLMELPELYRAAQTSKVPPHHQDTFQSSVCTIILLYNILLQLYWIVILYRWAEQQMILYCYRDMRRYIVLDFRYCYKMTEVFSGFKGCISVNWCALLNLPDFTHLVCTRHIFYSLLLFQSSFSCFLLSWLYYRVFTVTLSLYPLKASEYCQNINILVTVFGHNIGIRWEEPSDKRETVSSCTAKSVTDRQTHTHTTEQLASSHPSISMHILNALLVWPAQHICEVLPASVCWQSSAERANSDNRVSVHAPSWSEAVCSDHHMGLSVHSLKYTSVQYILCSEEHGRVNHWTAV